MVWYGGLNERYIYTYAHDHVEVIETSEEEEKKEARKENILKVTRLPNLKVWQHEKEVTVTNPAVSELYAPLYPSGREACELIYEGPVREIVTPSGRIVFRSEAEK